MIKTSVTRVLQQALLRKKAQTPRFSLRQMAKKLEISPSFLSQIINGRRKVPLQLVQDLCALLDLDHEKRDFILAALLQSKGVKGRPPLVDPSSFGQSSGEGWTQIPTKNFNFLKEWYYLPVLNSTLLKGYDGSANFIAERLELSTIVVESAMTIMLEAGLLEVRDGKRIKTNSFNEFQSASSKKEVRQFHASGMDKAKAVLREQVAEEDLERRLITTLVVTGSRQEVAWAKQRLAQVMKEIAGRMGAAPEEDVYQLSVQLFPLTIQPEKIEP